VVQQFNPEGEVSATANWYFMIVSTLLLGIGGAFVVSKFTIPRCRAFSMGDAAIETFEEPPKLTATEKKALRYAGLAALIYMLVIAALVIPPNAPLRNQETGDIVPSPFLRGLVPILFFLFAIPGYI
jgi:aminobenzoyl-glutamate transport protein